MVSFLSWIIGVFPSASRISFFSSNPPLTNFYQHYQNYDLLMIDGFEALAYDDIAQNVALHLFDALLKHNGQVIATTRVPTHRFPVMESYFRDAYTTELIGEILAPEIMVKNRHLLWGE